jgi:RNA polymerase sigma factor (sigma-70 family)
MPLDPVLESCKKGDVLSYQLLYNRYAKAMYNTCLRIVNNRSDAEDILQEAFCDAFQNLNAFEYKSSFGSWLKRIVVFKAINKVKRDKHRWFEITDTTKSTLQEEEKIDEAEFAFKVEEIKKAIYQLPDGYRTVLSLHLLENYKHSEIATMLDVSASTVRTQYIRAKSKLLQLLKDR